MSSATLDRPGFVANRLSPRYSTDVTTTGGTEDICAHLNSRSVDLAQQETGLAQFTVRIRESETSLWSICLWSVARELRNVIVHHFDLEANEDQVGSPGDAAASEAPWPEIWSKLASTALPHHPRIGSSSERPHARTELGRRLREIRQRIVASGEPLLSLEDLDREIAARRGERELEKK